MAPLPTSEPLAHRGVGTSQAAAQSLPRHVLRAQHKRMLEQYASNERRGLTNEEMEDRTGMKVQTVTPRRLELEEFGLIYNNDHETRANRSGRSAYVWRISEAGLTALREDR